MRRWAGLALILTTGCAEMCSGIHGGDAIGGYGGFYETQDVGGMSGSNGAAQSVCITSPPPGSPITHYAARCEDYEDTNAVTSLTDWSGAGTDGTSVGLSDPVFTDPCAAGYGLENPCVSFNGTNTAITNSTAPSDAYWTMCWVGMSAAATNTYILSRKVGGSGTMLVTGGSGGNPWYLFNGYEGVNYSMTSGSGSYGVDWISSGCVSTRDASTDPYFCIDDIACQRTTAPTGKRGSSWGGGLSIGRAQTGTYGQFDLFEIAVYDTFVDEADWEIYVEDIYGVLKQDTTP